MDRNVAKFSVILIAIFKFLELRALKSHIDFTAKLGLSADLFVSQN